MSPVPAPRRRVARRRAKDYWQVATHLKECFTDSPAYSWKLCRMNFGQKYLHLIQVDWPLRSITGAMPDRRATSSALSNLSRSVPKATNSLEL